MNSRRLSVAQLQEKATRYDLMVYALSSRGLTIQDDMRCWEYVQNGDDQPEELANSILQKRRFDAFLKTLPTAFVHYMGIYKFTSRLDESLVQEQRERYDAIVAVLAERGLELRRENSLCRQFISRGTGRIYDIVDTLEELTFLHAHTSYSSDCRAQGLNMCSHHYDYEGCGSDDSSKAGAGYQASVVATRERVKDSVRDKFLRDNPRGLVLPRKWERM